MKAAGAASRRSLSQLTRPIVAWLTTTLLAATALLPTFFLAFALLAFTFLSLAFFLLSATLLPRTSRFAWFVWIVLSFHITFRCYITNFSLIFSLFAIRRCLF